MITDIIEEIYVSMSRNKLRIALTGFSIAWGIFLLIVLLGAGNGLLHGMMSNFASQSVNSVTLWPGSTSIAGDGLPKYREIYMDLKDVEWLKQHFPKEIGEIQPTIETSVQLAAGQNHVSTTLTGVYPEQMLSGDYIILEGRNLNEIDVKDRRKVCLLHEKTVAELYGDGVSALGQWIKVQDLQFYVVGVYKTRSASRDRATYSPISTVATIYQPDQHYSELKLLVRNLETPEANEDFNRALRETLARYKQFDPNDRNAVWIWNSYEDYIQTQIAMNGLQIFIWIIGIATLIAGVTGISNIMLITVRERTHEFGIRKAIGARPSEIVRLVLLESVAITIVFGYIGLFFGLGLTELIGQVLSMGANDGEENFTIFQDPTVDLGIVIAATVVMVIAGVIAGYVPAKRAVSIKPIEALAQN